MTPTPFVQLEDTSKAFMEARSKARWPGGGQRMQKHAPFNILALS